MKTKFLVLALVLTSSLFYVGCKKEDSLSTVKIRMTDAPIDAEEVNIDLKAVMVNFDKDSSGWLSMQTTPGIYNLLHLQNGVDTLIGQGDYTGTVKEIRLIVGENNTIKVDGTLYPLTIPSGSESGLKIKVNKKLQATLETIVIDFDAALSIKQEGNDYKLRPVIKLK